jgi:hypothetical protein
MSPISDLANVICADFDPHVATGTAEVGGWTTRELLSILDGLNGLEVIGADVGTYILWVIKDES